MTSIVIPPTPSATPKSLSAAPWALSLWPGLVDGQCPASEFGSVQRSYRFVRFTGIRHFDEPEAAGASRLTVCYECDLFHGAVRFK
jgi:hypothetical protein